MSESIKERRRRDVLAAAEVLRAAGYSPMINRDGPFDISAFRKNEIRLILIIVGQGSEAEKRQAIAFPVPSVCVKEVWKRRPLLREFDQTSLN